MIVFERPLIDNPRSGRIRKVVSLNGRSPRSRHGLLLVEGPGAVQELLRYRPNTVVDVYVSQVAAKCHSDLVQLAQKATKWVHPVSSLVSRTISTDSQGIVAVARLEAISGILVGSDSDDSSTPGTTDSADGANRAFSTNGSGTFSEVSAGHHQNVPITQNLVLNRGNAPLVLLSRIQDPGNLGTLIRVTDAFGAQGLVTTAGSVEVANPKVIRASVGSCFHLPILQHANFSEIASGLRESGWLILGTSGGKGTVDLDDLLLSGLITGTAADSVQSKEPGLAAGVTTGSALSNESSLTDGVTADLSCSKKSGLPANTSRLMRFLTDNEQSMGEENLFGVKETPLVAKYGSLLGRPHVWVFGNEAQGLSEDELAACDYLVRLPMSGKAESLNVASAASCALYASQLVRRFSAL